MKKKQRVEEQKCKAEGKAHKADEKACKAAEKEAVKASSQEKAYCQHGVSTKMKARVYMDESINTDLCCDCFGLYDEDVGTGQSGRSVAAEDGSIRGAIHLVLSTPGALESKKRIGLKQIAYRPAGYQITTSPEDEDLPRSQLGGSELWSLACSGPSLSWYIDSFCHPGNVSTQQMPLCAHWSINTAMDSPSMITGTHACSFISSCAGQLLFQPIVKISLSLFYKRFT